MTDTIPEWALHEAAQIWCEKNHAAKQMDAAMVDSIARALASTAARVERERREADAAFIDDHDIGNSSSGPFVKPRLQGNQDGLAFAVAIRALPLKYGETP